MELRYETQFLILEQASFSFIEFMFLHCSVQYMTDSQFMIKCLFSSSSLISEYLAPVKSPGPAPVPLRLR